MTYAILATGSLVFLAHMFTFLFQKTKIPDVLPLMAIGIIAGPIAGLITPESFGEIGSVFSVVAMIIILFYSGLELKLSTLRDSMVSGARLVTVGFIFTVALTAIVAFSFLGFSFLEALLLGSIIGGTSSAIVIPIVGHLAISQNTKTTLILESTFSDVYCIVFALAFLKAIIAHNLEPGIMLGQIVGSFVLATIIGGGAAFFWSTILTKVRGLENSVFTTPAFVFLTYGVAELLGYSGGIAAFSFGVVLGNIHSFPVPFAERSLMAQPIKLNETERLFLGEIVFLLKTFFFVYIGLSMQLNNLGYLVVGTLLSIAILAARVPVIWLSLPKSTPRYDVGVVLTMMPKGLAAAVLASLCVDANIGIAGKIQEITYAVILSSIILSAIFVFLGEKRLLDKGFASLFSKFSDGANTGSTKSETP